MLQLALRHQCTGHPTCFLAIGVAAVVANTSDKTGGARHGTRRRHERRLLRPNAYPPKHHSCPRPLRPTRPLVFRITPSHQTERNPQTRRSYRPNQPASQCSRRRRCAAFDQKAAGRTNRHPQPNQNARRSTRRIAALTRRRSPPPHVSVVCAVGPAARHPRPPCRSPPPRVSVVCAVGPAARHPRPPCRETTSRAP